MKDLIKKHKILVSIGVALLIILVAVSLRLRYNYKFTAVAPKRGSITEAIYGIGTVKSNEIYDQKLGVMGKVSKLYIKEGDIVKQGALLLRTEDGVVFRAPFSGVVTILYFNENEIVMPGSTILKLVNLQDNYISVSLDQESAIRVRQGQKAELSFESIRGQTISGKVIKVYPSNGNFLISIAVDKMPAAILPDMTADVAIAVARRENILMIPLSSINRGIVRVKRGGRIQKIKVSIGLINDQWAEILDQSIKADDQIMVEKR